MKKLALLVVIASVLGFALQASASALSGPPTSFTVGVSASETGAVLSFTPTLGANPDGSFSASASGSNASFGFSSSYTLNSDPTLSGSFTLTSLSGITQIFTVSATLGLAPLAGPTTFHGGYGLSTYTDANGDSNVTFASPTLLSPARSRS